MSRLCNKYQELFGLLPNEEHWVKLVTRDLRLKEEFKKSFLRC